MDPMRHSPTGSHLARRGFRGIRWCQVTPCSHRPAFWRFPDALIANLIPTPICLPWDVLCS